MSAKSLTVRETECVCDMSVLMTCGDQEIIRLLRSLKHPAFDELYVQEDIRKLLGKPDPGRFGIVDVPRAVEICRLVNRVCSDRFEAVFGNKSPTISPKRDVFLLDKGGVQEPV